MYECMLNPDLNSTLVEPASWLSSVTKYGTSSTSISGSPATISAPSHIHQSKSHTIRLSSPESSILNIAPSDPLGGAVTKSSNSFFGKK